MKLGKIFKNNWKLLLGLIVVVLVLVFLKPFNWLSKLFGGNVNNLESLTNEVFLTMWTWGTDEKRLFELLEPLNKSDLKSVFYKFGNKPYGMGGRTIIVGKGLNLFGWFDKELTEKEKARMRDIWAKTGLNVTF